MRQLVCLITIAVLLSACGPGGPLGPTVTSTPTLTPTVIPTPMPSATPEYPASLDASTPGWTHQQRLDLWAAMSTWVSGFTFKATRQGNIDSIMPGLQAMQESGLTPGEMAEKVKDFPPGTTWDAARRTFVSTYGDEVWTITGPPISGAPMRLGKGSASTAVLSPDGMRLAVGSTIGVYLFQANTLEQVWASPTDQPVRCLAFSPDGKMLAVGPESGPVFTLGAQTGERLSAYNPPVGGMYASVAFSPDGENLAATIMGASYAAENAVIWDVHSKDVLWSIDGKASAVAFTPDSTKVIVITNKGYTYVAEARTGKETGKLNVVTSLPVWSPDGSLFATTGSVLTLRDAKTTQPVRWLSEPGDAAVWSPGGGRLVSVTSHYGQTSAGNWRGYSSLTVWDAATGKKVGTLPSNSIPSRVAAMTWLNDGQTVLLLTDDSQFYTWDVQSGQQQNALRGFGAGITSLVWSPDGKTLAAGQFDGAVNLWDPSTGNQSGRLEGYADWIESLAWSPDGEILAAGLANGNVVLRDIAANKTVLTLPGHSSFERPDPALSVAWSPDGKIVSVGYSGNSVISWDSASGAALYTVGYPYQNHHVAWSADGKSLLSSEASGAILQWDGQKGDWQRVLKTPYGVWIGSGGLAVSPDGTRLASISWNSIVTVWDNRTGDALHNEKEIAVAAFSPDGRKLALGKTDGRVEITDAASGHILTTFEKHNYQVSGLAWSPDGSILASSSADGSIILWIVAP